MHGSLRYHPPFFACCRPRCRSMNIWSHLCWCGTSASQKESVAYARCSWLCLLVFQASQSQNRCCSFSEAILTLMCTILNDVAQLNGQAHWLCFFQAGDTTAPMMAQLFADTFARRRGHHFHFKRFRAVPV